MNTAFKPMSWALLLTFVTGVAAAQDTPGTSPGVTSPGVTTPGTPASPPSAKSPGKSTPQIDAGEPRATTSPSPGNAAGATEPAGETSAGKPAAGDASKASGRGTSAAAAGRPAPKAAGAADRLDLGTATVTGDREQPKVMYIVPWKKSDIGDLSGKPMNSLLDEALAPVDRDEFKREVAYYNAVKSDTPQNGASAPAKQVEK
jgi:hypothetical protein